jgi:hypothetical protein
VISAILRRFSAGGGAACDADQTHLWSSQRALFARVLDAAKGKAERVLERALRDAGIQWPIAAQSPRQAAERAYLGDFGISGCRISNAPSQSRSGSPSPLLAQAQ